MPKRVLIQLDCDPQPSTFDAVVAVDAGADVLLRHGGVTVDNVVPLVHGAMFTRGGADLAATAIFIGGSDVEAAGAVADRVRSTFFGPVRVGVLVDPSGANTTAVATVVAAGRHVPLRLNAKPHCRALVLGGTGPVGQRVARLLMRLGAEVNLASRSPTRAAEVATRLQGLVSGGAAGSGATINPVEWAGNPVEWAGAVRPGTALARVVEQADVIIAAGAAGATLLDATGRSLATSAKVLIDLNAVPPAGIDGIIATDKAKAQGAAVVYGALGVGGTKMKIHRAAIERIFTQPDAFLDAEDLLAIGESLA